MSRVAVLGSGMVGDALSEGFLTLGDQVVRGTREPGKLAAWQQKASRGATVATFQDAVLDADVVVLAVKGSAAEDVVRSVGADRLAGKLVLDATNPIADAPPVHGVLSFFTTYDLSLMERLQRLAPDAHFVKAFSCVGNAHFFRPAFAGGPPTMFICGDAADAKREATRILQRFGWEVEDMGAVEAARAIEPLCILWCLPGFRENRWNHAFKLLRS